MLTNKMFSKKNVLEKNVEINVLEKNVEIGLKDLLKIFQNPELSVAYIMA